MSRAAFSKNLWILFLEKGYCVEKILRCPCLLYGMFLGRNTLHSGSALGMETIYHPPSLWKPHEFLSFGLEWINTLVPCGTRGVLFMSFCLLWIDTLVPGGARGVLLKSKFPNRIACAESCGFTREFRSRFSINCAWGVSLSHSWIGKVGSAIANPETK